LPMPISMRLAGAFDSGASGIARVSTGPKRG
jgi:hypothetical protein